MLPGQLTRPISCNSSLRPSRSGLKSLDRVNFLANDGTLCCVQEELRAKCSELERVDKAWKEAQNELKDAAKWGENMLHKFDSKEKAWEEEREKLLAELRAVKSEKMVPASHDVFQELASSQAQARAEALKAEAFQQSLVAARAALSRKAEQKELAEAARWQAVEEAAASLKKQEALEATSAYAEQMAMEAKAAQLQALQAASEQQRSLEAALAIAQQKADIELNRRGKVEKEATSRQELLRLELAAALAERAKVQAKHAAAEAAAKAETDKAQLALQEAKREAEDARATAADATATAEAAKFEKMKAEAAKVAAEKARNEAEVARADAEAEIAQIVARAEIASCPDGKSLRLSDAFAIDESEASTMTPRSTSGRTDADKIFTEETTDDKCEAESPPEYDTQACDTEAATENVSHKDETDVDDHEVSAHDEGISALGIESDESDNCTERTSTQSLLDVLQSAMQMPHLKQQDCHRESTSTPEPEAESSPVSMRRQFPGFFGFRCSEIEKHSLGVSTPSSRAGSSTGPSTKKPPGHKSPSMRQRKGAKTGPCNSKQAGRGSKRGASHTFLTHWLAPWFALCIAGVFVMLCALRLKSRSTLQELVASKHFVTDNAIQTDHFSSIIQGAGTFSVKRNALKDKLEEARRNFSLKPKPRNALWLASLLMNMESQERVSEALEVLLRTIDMVADGTIDLIESSALIICALYSNAGTLLVRTGKVEQAVQYYHKALMHLDTEEGSSNPDYRSKVHLNLAAAEMMRSNWGACSKQAQLAASESEAVSDRTVQYAAQSLLSGCLFRTNAPTQKALVSSQVAMRLAPSDQFQQARENCLALEEAAARRVAGIRLSKEVNMKIAAPFKFLAPELP